MENKIDITRLSAISIHPDDVILWKYDTQAIDFESAYATYNVLKECFPNNKVIAMDKTQELIVFREEDENGNE